MKRYAFAIKIFFSLGLLALLMWRMDHDVLRNVFEHIQPSAWAYAILFTVLQFLILSARWMMLVNIGRKNLSYLNASKITLAGQLANLVFITSIGGIFVRIAMAMQYGAGLLKAFMATAIDRAMTLSALVFLSAIFLPFLGGYLDHHIYTPISMWIGTFTIILFVFSPLFLIFVLRTAPTWQGLPRRLKLALRYLSILVRRPQRLALTIVLSLIGQIFFFLSVFVICLSSGLDLSFSKLMIVLPIISLVAGLPLSIGGWGIREGAFVFGLGLLGAPMEMAFLISVQIGLIGMLTTLIAGIPMLMTMDTSVVTEQAKMLAARVRRSL